MPADKPTIYHCGDCPLVPAAHVAYSVHMRSPSAEAPHPEQSTDKSKIKGLIRRWHPDLSPGVTRGKNHAVIHILGSLNTALNEGSITSLDQGWPESVSDDTKVDLSSDTTIYLPTTPRAFIDALDQYERGELDPKDYPRVTLERSGNARKNKKEREEDTTLDKFLRFVEGSDSIDALVGTFDLFSLYSEDQLREINIPGAVDTRASFLFTRAAWNETTKEGVETVLEHVRSFPFFSETVRAHTLTAITNRTDEIVPETLESSKPSVEEILGRRDMERAARQSFVARVRLADTQEALNALDAEARNFNFFNRGELGVIRSVIVRKMSKIEGVDNR